MVWLPAAWVSLSCRWVGLSPLALAPARSKGLVDSEGRGAALSEISSLSCIAPSGHGLTDGHVAI